MADEDQDYLDELQRQRAEQERLAREKEVVPPVIAPVEQGVTAASRAVDYSQRGLPTVNEANPAALPQQGAPLNQQEDAFWSANPNGAVKDPETGMLIGLGSGGSPDSDTRGNQPFMVNAGLGPPAIPGQGLGVQQQSRGFEAPQQMTVHDFINPAIQSRRGELANERSIINRNLQSFSKVAPGRGQKSPWQLELEKLKVIDHADGVLQKEQHQQSELKRKVWERNSELQEKTAINQDVAGVHNALSNLKARPGSDEYRQALIGIRQQYPNAMKDASVESKLLDLSTTHDREAEAVARLREAGQQVEVTGVGPKGERYGVKPTMDQSVTKATQVQVAKDFARSGMTPEQFAQRGEVVGTDEKGNQVEDGTHIKVTLPGGHHATMDKATYDRLNTAVPATQPNPAAEGAQPAATPSPRIALAQKALQDPNASEQDKAQARRILGAK